MPKKRTAAAAAVPSLTVQEDYTSFLTAENIIAQLINDFEESYQNENKNSTILDPIYKEDFLLLSSN